MAFTRPKMTATASRVSTFDAVLPWPSWMPGTSHVATASAAAVRTARISTRMRQSSHDERYGEDPAGPGGDDPPEPRAGAIRRRGRAGHVWCRAEGGIGA